ncbi:MAG TPA: tetratricopeptide repeat protein, partial [Gemmatimonadaceae bacterium]|nr:tetratricopeptide repeat protein [Gemmatimonadaceae bacterium]
STETALRSLMGSTVLGGQPLIRELRHRELISIGLAHALLEFLAVRERIQDTAYRPSTADISAAREAFQMLQDGLMIPGGPATVGGPAADVRSMASESSAPASEPAPRASSPPPGNVGTVPPTAFGDGHRTGPPPVLFIGAGVLVLFGLVGAIVWYLLQGSGEPSAMEQARRAYAAGLRDSARAVFAKVALENPNLHTPFVYLGRIAREQGDFPSAAKYLTRAAQLAPDSAIVHRELGSYFLTRGGYYAARQRPDLALSDYNAARRSLVRAVQLAPNDASAKGYLGCALVRAGRPVEGARFLSLAGDGPWRQCAPPAPGAALPRVQ